MSINTFHNVVVGIDIKNNKDIDNDKLESLYEEIDSNESYLESIIDTYTDKYVIIGKVLTCIDLTDEFNYKITLDKLNKIANKVQKEIESKLDIGCKPKLIVITETI